MKRSRFRNRFIIGFSIFMTIMFFMLMTRMGLGVGESLVFGVKFAYGDREQVGSRYLNPKYLAF